jgi:hypothetical protein
VTARQVHRDLGRLVDLGLLALPDEGTTSEITPTEDERSLISEDLYRYDASLYRYRMLTGWGAVRTLAVQIGSPRIGGFDSRLDRYRRLLDTVDLRRPVTVPEIIDLAYLHDLPIGVAVDVYKQLFPATADLSALPPAALTSPVTCHRAEERVALLGSFAFHYGEYEVGWSLRPADVVLGSILARQSITALLDRLEPFRELGAPLPNLDESAQRSLDDPLADRYDRAMLLVVDERSGRERPVGAITPLWLMQMAGRFGWTLLQAHHRMARLQPLGLSLHYPADACYDEIVAWQDLLLATEHLDGEEPAVSGRIDMTRLAAGAAEVRESVDQVLIRLRRYAPLFGFSIDEEIR